LAARLPTRGIGVAGQDAADHHTAEAGLGMRGWVEGMIDRDAQQR